MFVGHYSAAFVGKAAAPGVPLWLFMLAAQLVDVVWGGLVLVGVERVRLDFNLASNPLDLEFMPYTHSLVATGLWGAATYSVARRWFGAEARVALVIAATVTSHWFLDLLVHRSDLPILVGEPKLGFALWNHPLLGTLLEIAVLLGALLLAISRQSWRKQQLPRVLAFAAFLVAAQVAVVVGPLPQSVPAMIVTTECAFLGFAALAAFVEVPPKTTAA